MDIIFSIVPHRILALLPFSAFLQQTDLRLTLLPDFLATTPFLYLEPFPMLMAISRIDGGNPAAREQ